MFPFIKQIQTTISFLMSQGMKIPKFLITLPFTLLSFAGKFVLTRPWLSGVAVVCAVLALLMVGYGPKMSWNHFEETANDYVYSEDGFLESDSPSVEHIPNANEKFELEEPENSEIVEIIRKRPELTGPRFGGSQQFPLFHTKKISESTSTEQNLELSTPPAWSQQANRSSTEKRPQRPQSSLQQVASHAPNKSATLRFPSMPQSSKSPILKASADEPASSAWLMGIIEEEPMPQTRAPHKSTAPFQGQMIIRSR